MSDVTIWEHQLFEGLPQSQRLWLSDRLEQKTFAARTNIFQPGDLANQLFVLLEGIVKIEVSGTSKKWFIQNIFLPKDIFGLTGLLGRQTYRGSARSLRSAVKVIIIKHTDLRQLIEVNFDFAERIMALTASHTRHLEQRSLSHSIQSAPARFASFLIEQINKNGGKNGSQWFYNSQLTQEEIGAYIGTGRQTVTEILTDFKAKNILTYKWGKFWVHDFEALKKMISD